jgi:hypothetical protein
VETANPGFSGLKAGFGYSGKFTLDWRPTRADQFQISGNYNGQRLSPQGYSSANGGVDAGYRRQLTPDLAWVVNVNDLFNSRIQRTAYRNPVARLIVTREPQGRTASIGLTWRLGGPSRNSS